MSNEFEQKAVALEPAELESSTEGLEEGGAGAAEQGAVRRRLFVDARAPEGGDGSSLRPFSKIRRALTRALPGDIILVRAGTYTEGIVLDEIQAGTPDAHITLLGEGMPKLLASADTTLVQVKLPHWRIDGFELDMNGRFARAVSFQGNTQGSSLARCDMHDGTHNAGVSISEGACGVTIEDNKIHNFRHKNPANDTHGVVVQPNCEDITIRGNHIHDIAGDAVQVFSPEDGLVEESAQRVLIEDNRLESTTENAVDIKTSRYVTVKNNIMRDFRSIGPRSKGDAVVVHYSAKDVTIENNDISEAGSGISVGGRTGKGMPGPKRVMVRNNTIRDIRAERALNNAAFGIRVNKARVVKILDNTIQVKDGFALRLGGVGEEGSSDDVTVMGNTMCSAKLVQLVREAPGFEANSNHYAREGRFRVMAGRTLNLTEWRKSTGQDADSDEVDCEGTRS